METSFDITGEEFASLYTRLLRCQHLAGDNRYCLPVSQRPRRLAAGGDAQLAQDAADVPDHGE
jgi:hypothetical protein